MLIQEIRAREALKELGRTDEVRIDHATPRTWIGDKEYLCVYPKYFLDYLEPKIITMVFSGTITPSRKKFLDNFPRALVIDSHKGWDEKLKYDKDEAYFKLMAQSKFVLCPNGCGLTDREKKGFYGDPAFAWTYRFFDAIFFLAIPIVEEDLKIYEGYHYYKLGDNYEYNEEWVRLNLAKAKAELML